jgi:hypothetical protein
MIPGASPYQLLKVKKVVSIRILKESSFSQIHVLRLDSKTKQQRKNNKSGKSGYASYDASLSPFFKGLHFIFQGPCKCAKPFTVP